MINQIAIFITVLLFMSVELFSQSHSSVVNEIKIPSLSLTEFTREGNFLVEDGIIYRVVNNPNSDFFIDRFDLAVNEYSKLDIEMTDDVRNSIDALHLYQTSYALDRNLFYLRRGNSFFRFKMMPHKIEYDAKIELKSSVNGRYFAVRGDTILIHQVYNSPQGDKAFLYLYSWSQNEIISYKKFDYRFPQYSHVGEGKHYFDFGDKQYLMAQGIDYRIDLYNYDHEYVESVYLEDSIHFPILDNDHIAPFKNDRAIALAPLNYIPSLTELPNKGGRIWEAQFVHDSLIIVKYSVPDQEKGMIFKDDLWLKKNGEWILTETIPLYCQNDERINSSNFWRFNLYNSANIIANGNMYYILFNSASKTFDLTYEEFSTNTRMNETQLKIYTVDFNE